jgi:predicted O-methyltransferase YrrM
MSISVVTWVRHARDFVSWDYLRDRLDIAFLAAAVSRTLYEIRNPLTPWINPEMVAVLENVLKPGDEGFEFGSGTSTIWLGQRVRRIHSVEHDTAWAGKVQGMIEEHGLAGKVELIRVAHGDEGTGEGKEAYVAPLRRVPSESLDFCFVDGLFRDVCIEESIRVLRRGGVLILDNADTYFPKNRVSRSVRYKRDNFSQAVSRGLMETIWSELAGWRCVWTTTPIQDTALWIKP